MVSRDHIKGFIWVVSFIFVSLFLYFYVIPFIKRKPFPQDSKLIAKERLIETKIFEYGSNRIGDVDKFLFDNGGNFAWVHFPPHTAGSVMHVAPKDAMRKVAFAITGKKGTDGRMMYELRSVKSSIDSFAVRNLPPPPPESGTNVELTGQISDYKLDEKGMVAGFIMGQYIIEIPKHVDQTLIPLLKKATILTVKGYQRNGKLGFVNTTGLLLVKPTAIIIDKTNYLL